MSTYSCTSVVEITAYRGARETAIAACGSGQTVHYCATRREDIQRCAILSARVTPEREGYRVVDKCINYRAIDKHPETLQWTKLCGIDFFSATFFSKTL